MMDNYLPFLQRKGFNQIKRLFNCSLANRAKKPMATANELLNSRIRLQETRIARSITVPSQICFCLDASILEDIEWMRQNHREVVLSPTNLANLRCYALLNFLEQTPLARSLPTTRVSLARSPLTFSTNYQFSDRQSPTTLLRSIIEPEGKISQQISQQLWGNPQLLQRISQAHYWLISEILTQLPFKGDRRAIWLARAGLMLATVLIVTAIDNFLSLNIWSSIAVALVLFFCLKFFWTKLGLKYFKTWIIYHLLIGWFAKSEKKRQIGLSILNSIV